MFYWQLRQHFWAVWGRKNRQRRARKKEDGKQKTFNLRHESIGVGKEGNIALIVSLVLGPGSPLSHLGVLGNRVAEFGQGD